MKSDSTGIYLKFPVLSANFAADLSLSLDLMVCLQKERRALEMRRLDLDAAKTKLKRAKSEKGRSDVSIKQGSYLPGRHSALQNPCKTPPSQN